MGNVKILFADLESGKTHTIQRGFPGLHGTGGKALGIRLLEEYLNPACDPLSPANVIVLLPSPLAGYAFPGSNRLAAFTKSPLTGIWLEAYVGGSVSRTFRESGWDALVITGSSSQPVRLHVNSEGANLVSAEDLWGQDSFETEHRLKAGLDKRSSVLCIGPAGEHLVATSSVMHEEAHAFGRGGLGAVFGSKRLKAVSFTSPGPMKLESMPDFSAVRVEVSKLAASSPAGEKYRLYGTPMMVALMNDAGAFPSGLFEKGKVDHRETLEAEHWSEWAEVENDTCPPCPMSCRKRLTLADGKDVGRTIHGPEYETLYAFGGSCMVKHARDVAYLSERCNRLGLDTISTGNLIALAGKAALRGLPQSLRYFEGVKFPNTEAGDPETIAVLLDDIAFQRTPLGELLSRGMDAAAKVLGVSDLVITSKGLDPAGYEPRKMKAMALSYALSPRGACHLRTSLYKAELSGMTRDLNDQEFVELYIDWEDRLLLADSLIQCRFYRDFMTWERIETCVGQLAGIRVDRTDLQALSSDTLSRIRRLNFAMGLSPADDTLPARFFEESTDTAPALDRAELERWIHAYWRMRGWGEDGTMNDPSVS